MDDKDTKIVAKRQLDNDELATQANDKKKWLKLISEFQPLRLVVSPGFEPGQADSETAVLPLHHETIIIAKLQKIFIKYKHQHT